MVFIFNVINRVESIDASIYSIGMPFDIDSNRFLFEGEIRQFRFIQYKGNNIFYLSFFSKIISFICTLNIIANACEIYRPNAFRNMYNK